MIEATRSSIHPRVFWALLSCLLLSACGGGGGGGGGSGPPTALSYASAPILVVGTAMAPLTPTMSGGAATNFSVMPTLPAGLSLNAMTGVISGTPTQGTASNVYSVTASNKVGSVRDNVPLMIVSSLYTSSTYTLTQGVASVGISPTASNQAVDTWSVSPSLPAGLSLNSDTGQITGTPTAATAAASYVVSTSASGGASSQTLMLQVVASPLLDLGHATAVFYESFVNPILLTQDGSGHWVLWNYATGQNLANSTSPLTTRGPGFLPTADLKGSTVVIQTTTGLQVRSATDGTVLAEISTTPSWWAIARDGSYICAGSSTALSAWSPGGTLLFTAAGNYSQSLVYAAPGQIQVALGAKGANVIETLTVPARASSTGSTFNGTFQSWFTDGSHFTTATGNTAWIYSNASVQEDLASLPSTTGLGGYGTWYWTGAQQNNVYSDVANCCGALTVYAVGSAGKPSGTYGPSLVNPPGPIPSGSTVGINTGTVSAPQTTVVDFSGATLAAVVYNLPATVGYMSGYGAASSSTWVGGSGNGVLFDGASLGGQPRYLDYGAATGIAGSSANVAVATASGRIVYFDAVTHALLGTIDQLAWQIAESADGSVLAAASGQTSAAILTVTTYALPSGAVTGTFTTPDLDGITVSGSGTALGEGFVSASPCFVQIVALPGGGPVLCETTSQGTPMLSADGSLTAIVSGSDSTNIYANGKLATAVTGLPVTWFGNNLLASQFVYNYMTLGNEYTGADLFSATGQLVGSPPLPALGPAQTVSATTVYDGSSNAIYSLTTGQAVWASGSPIQTGVVQPPFGPGVVFPPWSAVAGSYVVFESGNLILAEPE